MQPKEVTSTTLRLDWPFGLTLVLAILFAAGIAALGEAAARADFLSGWLPRESIGSGQPQLDKKLVLLREAMQRRGGLDCLFFGSSQVYRSVDPSILEETFQTESGKTIRSFNFGLGGMSETAEAPLARVLVKKFRPRLIVVGVSSYGMDERRDIKFEKYLNSSPWFRFQLGRHSVDGWLLEHSVALRRYHGYLFSTDPSSEAVLVKAVANMTATGYHRLAPGKFSDVDERAAKELGEFQVSPSHLEALSELLRLRSPKLEMIVVEVPVHENVVKLYGRGAADHRHALTQIERVAGRHEVPFWRFPAEQSIPQNGWADAVHLNRAGAEIYSRWLGRELAAAARQGRVTLPPVRD